MEIRSFEVGQLVYIINMHDGRNSEPTVIETKVNSIGRKFLNTDNGHRYMSSENPYGLDEYVEWGDKTLLCPSETDAKYHIEKNYLEKWLKSIPWNDIKKCTLEQLRQIKDILER